MKDPADGTQTETELDGRIDPESGLPILAMPREGMPPLVDDDALLAECIEALGSGTGPVAIDTERAQSFRYSGRAYLLQLRRSGADTWLIDPQAFEPGDGSVADLGALREAIIDAEWRHQCGAEWCGYHRAPAACHGLYGGRRGAAWTGAGKQLCAPLHCMPEAASAV